MDIKLISETYDEDPLDDTARDGDTVRIMGVRSTMCPSPVASISPLCHTIRSLTHCCGS